MIVSGAASRCFAFGTAAVPSGLISVMPQPWMTAMPCRFSNASIRAGGTAEPPDRAHRVARRHRSRVGRGQRPGMQHGGAVAVERAFGLSRGARGVAQRRGGPFVEDRPGEIGVFGRDQLVITGEHRESGLTLAE